MAPKYLMRLGDDLKEVEIDEGPEGIRVQIDDQWHTISLEQIGDSSLYSLIVDDHPYEFFAEEQSGGFDIVIGPQRYSVLRASHGRRAPPPPAPAPASEVPGAAGGWVVLSPMMGVVQEICVSPGDTAEVGELLAVIEAMKMNNELRAQRSGRVAEIYVSVGQRVEQGSALLLMA